MPIIGNKCTEGGTKEALEDGIILLSFVVAIFILLVIYQRRVNSTIGRASKFIPKARLQKR